MATGYTQIELDALEDILDSLAPPIPTMSNKNEALKVTAMRTGIADKGAIFNFETKGGAGEMYWLNCTVARELATAVSYASSAFEWSGRGFKVTGSDHLREPKPEDVASAAEVLSLSTFAVPKGLLVRFAIGQPVKHLLLFFPRNAALEIMLGIGQGGTRAQWWVDESFELIPSKASQN